MRIRILFCLTLTVFLVLYIWYGVNRFALGIDLTDEGAYLSLPMRMLFGEKPFTSELMTLIKPIELYLFIPFKLFPSTTLYEFRLAGWLMHLFSFSVLTTYLYRLSHAPLLSPLIASIPLFACHLFGLASPSYNTLSSDFLLIALSLRGLSTLAKTRWQSLIEMASGLALFVATLSHPALGAVAVAILAHESIKNSFVQNLLTRQLTPSNRGVAVFIACWLIFLVYAITSGALVNWLQRIPLAQSLSATALRDHPIRFLLQLGIYPFQYSSAGTGFAFGAVIIAGTWRTFAGSQYDDRGKAALAFLLIVALIYTFSYQPHYLPICFAMVSLILIGVQCSGSTFGGQSTDSSLRFLLLLSGLGALLYAAFTYYFSSYRSWMSGIQGLPFAFAVGLTLLLKTKVARPNVLRVLAGASVFIMVVCEVQEHYRQIYRDLPPVELDAYFQLPKLRHIKSTRERVRALDALYTHLHPKLSRGEPLLVFDECPMIYYLFDAMPAYNYLAASRYNLTETTLQLLNDELKSKPLPNYAIRTLVDVSNPIWSTAPRLNYSHYPLSDTVTDNYELEQTIFPFEIWRLKSPALR